MRFIASLLLCVLVLPLVAEPVGKSAVVKAAMQKFVDAGELSGVVTFVGTKDGIVDIQVLGMADLENEIPMKRDTMFRIASMTKPITALAIMQLVEEGKVKVEDPVEKYLPDFRGQMMVASRDKETVTLKKPARPITLKDLLTHTSGLPNYPPGMANIYGARDRTLNETIIAISQAPLMFEPGTKWSYCNPGIDTLGRIIEVVSGMPYETFLATQIFQPLGMVDTTPYPTGEQRKRVVVSYGKKNGKLVAMPGVVHFGKVAKHPVPAGGLFSTGDDLAKLYQCFLNNGALNGKTIISAKSLADMTTIHTGNGNGGFIGGMTWGYGFAIVKESKGMTENVSPGSYGHSGAYSTQGWIDPTKGIYTILLIQRTDLSETERSAIRKALHDASVTVGR